VKPSAIFLFLKEKGLWAGSRAFLPLVKQ